MKKSVYHEVIHRDSDTLGFFHLDLLAFNVEQPKHNVGVPLRDESIAEETEGVTTAVDDVKNRVFKSAISRLIFDIGSLDGSKYF